MKTMTFFEAIEDIAVVTALLDRARDWIKARGMTVMRGPGEYSNATYERQGVLIDGFEYPPTVELTHNPPYYDRLLHDARPDATFVALAFECQLVDEVPMEANDVYMDKVITEKGVYEGKAGRGRMSS